MAPRKSAAPRSSGSGKSGASASKRAVARPKGKTPTRKPRAAAKGKPTKAPARRKRTAAAEKSSIDLAAFGAHVVSVFGPFASRVLIELPAKQAAELFKEPLGAANPTSVVEALERDLAKIRERDEQVANSALAASAIALAREIEHPFNSATSKSMCAGKLYDAWNRLLELAPPQEEADQVDEYAARARAKLDGGSKA
jgi:hypothetical protein